MPCGPTQRAPDPPFGEHRRQAGGTLRVFTCACGKVRAGSFLASSFSAPKPSPHPLGCRAAVLSLSKHCQDTVTAIRQTTPGPTH